MCKGFRGTSVPCGMGTTFTTDLRKSTLSASGCLCSQMAPSWSGVEVPTNVEELAKFANPSCPWCDGTGVEVAMAPDPSYRVDLSLGNASLVLAALGLQSEDPLGSAPISEFMEACEEALEHPEEFPSREEETSRAFRLEGGVIHYGPQVLTQGISQEGVADRIVRLKEFATKMAALGATEVRWY